jgi:hypothetical protein
MPAMAAPGSGTAEPAAPALVGQYIESRTADIYPICIANGEVNLIGREAILAWHVDRGVWGNVALDGLTVIAVVRASNTLGDPDSSPLPARAKLIVDINANAKQRAALVNFVQEQAGELLTDIIAVEAAPIQFTRGKQPGTAVLRAGNQLRLATAALDVTMLPASEVASYPPLASHVTNAIPAVSTESVYSGSELGVHWNESGRAGSFVGNFAL